MNPNSRTEPTNRYLLFAGDDYYPGGGWADFRGSFPTYEAALLAVAPPCRWDWYHVVDTLQEKIIDHNGLEAIENAARCQGGA